MRVMLGNPAPKSPTMDLGGAPTVTYMAIPDSYTLPATADDSLLPAHIAGPLAGLGTPELTREVRRALIRGEFAHPSGVKGLPDHEALVSVIHPGGLWGFHSNAEAPSWVWSDNDVLAKMVADHFDTSLGLPADFAETHWRHVNGITVPPGFVDPLAEAQMLKVNSGFDFQSWEMGGGPNLLGSFTGSAGFATASGTTSLTNSGAAFPTSTVSGEAGLAGQIVVYGPNNAGTGAQGFGVIVSNTATVLTVDAWYAFNGLGAGTTPNATASYAIIPGAPPAPYMALTANATAPSATDTTLTAEITTAAGGLKRKISPYAHTAAGSTYTLTPVFTANGSDSLPVTVAKIGVFNTVTPATGVMLFETLLNATATLTISGDQLTVTETVTM